MEFESDAAQAVNSRADDSARRSEHFAKMP
jgi:hypothetical protein